MRAPLKGAFTCQAMIRIGVRTASDIYQVEKTDLAKVRCLFLQSGVIENTSDRARMPLYNK